MNLVNFQKAIAPEYQITRMTHREQFVLHLGQKACVTLFFDNDGFTKMLIDGKDKEKIAKIFENIVDKDKIKCYIHK